MYLALYEPLVKFRRAIRMILIVLRFTSSSRERSQRLCNNQSANFLGSNWTASKSAYEMYGISFDPQDFKARREIPVSAEAKAVLSLETNKRTQHQLRLALVSLRQAVKEFSEFPITMQESLVKVGWYENFEAKRVIIRQGHTAENFYFILSGTAAVVILESDKQTGEQVPRTAAFLGRGKSFGELALMHKSRRSATVTCKDDVELLAVGREDFIDIFMHVKEGVEPEHVSFLRTVPILREWPIHVLPLDDPTALLFTYVRRGVLLCKDSNTSTWLYVVKSGHCRVIKALRAVSPVKRTTPRDLSKLDSPKSKSSLSPFPRLPNIGEAKAKKGALGGGGVEHVGAHSGAHGGAHVQAYRPLSLLSNRDPWIDERNRLEHLQTLDAILEQQNIHFQYMAQNRSSGNLDSPSKSPTRDNKDRKVVFVEVMKLGQQDIYGLESCVFGPLKETTSTSLVSEGAEVIMIDRKYFMDRTSEELRKKIRGEIRPLPSTETLQAQLDTMVNWEVYKQQTLKEALDSRRRKKSNSDKR
ncbi:cyclic nucleotide-binding domain-containing protein 2-like isoform X3 [Biomphalaria glabrata]|uniref:Cyclic nucleotide-binding domain-containing protein 2-like isoform X3 n=1 Tax=Biomphalaria glabrata TaxID=6526 RepID=A0A9W3B7W5_BIOGL|nr:cyclic nucleotide-binding domain-containing protein 2-like isoform X3 [Biomphalaria glabrata]